MSEPKIEVKSPLEMRELDPSPVEETPKESSGDGYFPPNPVPIRRSTTFLGLGDHGPAYYLSKIQRYSSYAFTIFGFVHITNTAIIPLVSQSVATADSYLLLTRPIYQSQPQEPLLVVAPLALHVLSGVALRIYRRRQAAARYGATSHAERRHFRWPHVSGTSKLGFALVPMLLGHTLVVRALPLWFEGSSANSGLGFVAHGFAKFPLMNYIGYGAFVSVAVWHIAWGSATWLAATPAYVKGDQDVKKKRDARWYLLNSIAAAVTLVWLAGGLGVVGRGGAAEGWLAGVYDGLYKRIPLVRNWI